MTKIWLASATSFRTLNAGLTPRPLPIQDNLQRRMDRFGSRSDMARSGAVNATPQPLDAQLIEDGAALEAAWQGELRSMIAARRGGAQEKAAARAVRAASEDIVRRIETARALTLDGLKVKARAESWRRDGEPLGLGSDDDEESDSWSEMGEMPQYDAPAQSDQYAHV
jgi:hypothetical protein